jgi:hypothetical protein
VLGSKIRLFSPARSTSTKAATFEAVVNGPTWFTKKKIEWTDSETDSETETEAGIQKEIEAEANGKIVSVTAAIINPVQPIE